MFRYAASLALAIMITVGPARAGTVAAESFSDTDFFFDPGYTLSAGAVMGFRPVTDDLDLEVAIISRRGFLLELAPVLPLPPARHTLPVKNNE